MRHVIPTSYGSQTYGDGDDLSHPSLTVTLPTSAPLMVRRGQMPRTRKRPLILPS